MELMNATQKVKLFMEKAGQICRTKPTTIPALEWAHRMEYMAEEVEEYITACEEGDIVGIADALGDQLYILLGTFVAHGIWPDNVFNLIHEANMNKFAEGGFRCPDTGKWKKPPGWEGPEKKLALEIVRQKELDLWGAYPLEMSCES